MSTLVGSFRLHPVWLLVGALTAASVGLWYGSLSALGPLVDSPTIPWLALAAAFGGVEAVVVHVHFRSEATTFSFLELPLVLGIVFAPGSHVWTAMTIGVAISLLVVRRQPPIKAAFNTANLSLQAGVAVVVMHALVPETGPLTPHGWLVAGLATTVSSWASISAIVAAIVVTEGRTDRNRIAEMLAFGSLVSLTNTTLALVAASLLDYRPASLALVIVPIIMLYAAYRSYVSERAQRERVQFLYRSTSDLRAMDKHATIPELLHNSVSMFRAQSAHLFVLPSATTDAPIIRFSSGNDATAAETLDRTQSESVRSVLSELPRPLLVTPELAEKLEPLFSCSPRTGMIGALGGDRDAVALLLVLNRLGDVTDFTHDDLGLFSTLAEQLALALVNDQLEQAVAELQQVEQELAHRASHDTLTGLADRSVLSAALDRALADGEPATVLYIDLDDFKVINDSLGHRAGDIVLVETSVRLRAEVRPSDCVARLGGDEFAIALFTAVDPEAIARRIIDSIHRPITIAGHEVCVGASIGLSRATPHQPTAELLESADTAMYAAKARGKGSVEIYRPDLRDDEPQHGRQRTSLRQALDDDEIAVAYQPIIDLATNETVGFEALARWRAPDGPVPARDFIDNAERQGLIIPIDDRVMQQAFSDFPRIVDRIPTTGFLTMNLSQRNIADATLIGRVSQRLRDSGVDPTMLVVEITEPGLHRDLSQVTAHLAALKDLGVRIALDDFGAGPGPCSITTVQELPLDILKISGSVVRNGTTDRRLLSGLVGLGRSLGLTLIAEGIESTSQRDTVRRLGCRLGQGYALGRPVMRGDLHLQLSQRGRPSFSSE